MRIEEHKFKKDSFATKKSRVKKRSFIGDGDRDRDITQSKMFEIEN